MSDKLNELFDKIVEESHKNIHFPYNYLIYQLNSIEKLKREADKIYGDITEEKIPEWSIHGYNSALINIISGFEFFFRELVQNENILNSRLKEKYYNIQKGQYTNKGNFQNYNCIREFLKDEFKIDIETKLEPLELEWLQLLIYERHLLIHNGGIVDTDLMNLPFLSELEVSGYSIGRRLWVESKHIDIAIKIVKKVGQIVEEYLKTLDRQIVVEKA